MPKYSYTAKTTEGKTETGFMEAEDIIILSSLLKKQGLVLINAKKQGGFNMEINIEIPYITTRVSLVDKLMFTRNLQVMSASGLAVPKALDILKQQAENKYFAKILAGIQQDIIKGGKFSESLKKHPKIFSELYANMIQLGEETGNMEKVLDDLAYQMEKEHALKSKVKGALTYPTVIIVAMLLIGAGLITFVIPKLASVFNTLKVELPTSTQFVLKLGDYGSNPWIMGPIFAGIILFIILIIQMSKHDKGKLILDKIILSIPVISKLTRQASTAGIISTLSTLLASGLPIVRSLEIISNTTGNIYFRNSLLDAAKKVQKGTALSEALAPYSDLYSITVVQMLKIGEETGESSKILAKIADFYQEEVERTADNLSTIIEPVLMLIVGGIVAFFAVAMFSPIYSMMGEI